VVADLIESFEDCLAGAREFLVFTGLAEFAPHLLSQDPFDVAPGSALDCIIESTLEMPHRSALVLGFEAFLGGPQLVRRYTFGRRASPPREENAHSVSAQAQENESGETPNRD